MCDATYEEYGRYVIVEVKFVRTLDQVECLLRRVLSGFEREFLKIPDEIRNSIIVRIVVVVEDIGDAAIVKSRCLTPQNGYCFDYVWEVCMLAELEINYGSKAA